MSESTATGPLVSVIVAAYKQPAMLNEALASIAAQTYRAIEIVVVDDASGPEHVAQYRLPANARLIVNGANVGRASIVRNMALREVRGDYVAFLDQDDLWHREKIARQVALMEETPELLMTFCSCAIVSMTGEVRDACWPTRELKGDALAELLRANLVRAPSCVLVRRIAFEKAGPFDERIKGSADYDMWLRLAGQGKGAVKHQHEPLTLYRVHDTQWSRDEYMITRGGLAVMLAAREWLPRARPDLVGLLRKRTARWLHEAGLAAWRADEPRSVCRSYWTRAMALTPLMLRPYKMWFRSFYRSR